VRKVVRFRAGDERYAVDLAHVVRVEAPGNLRALPDARPGVLGLLPGAEAVPVVAALGEGGRRVLVLEAQGKRFGLAVQEVSEVSVVAEVDLFPAPEGQEAGVVLRVVREGGETQSLLIDPAILLTRLVNGPDAPGAALA
jgi:chemotaxis signal transduction protein